jgi:hypothetical protein
MVWGFCYLRIFKKVQSISGRSLSDFRHFLKMPRLQKKIHKNIFMSYEYLQNLYKLHPFSIYTTK